MSAHCDLELAVKNFKRQRHLRRDPLLESSNSLTRQVGKLGTEQSGAGGLEEKLS